MECGNYCYGQKLCQIIVHIVVINKGYIAEIPKTIFGIIIANK
jgi:hypothetical protein